MSWHKEWKPEILCLGAGGMKGLDELGALWWFWSEGVLANVDHFIGCSIGGIICTFLSIGYWPHEILAHALDTTLFKNASEIQITGVAKDYGLVSNSIFSDALSKNLRSMIIAKCGKIPTFAEHYKMTGKKLYLAVASLKARKPIYISVDTHPDLDLFVACRSTSNMPVVFGKLEHQKDYFVDGAVMDPLPALHLDDGKKPMLVIGVMDDCPWVFEKVGVMSYFDRILAMSLQALTENTLSNCSKACYTLIIPVSDDVGLIESSTREARAAKFMNGYKFAERYVKEHPHQMPPVVTQALPPLSKGLVTACLQSNAGKTLLRCLSENPSLFEECAGLKPQQFKPAHVEEVPPPTKPEQAQLVRVSTPVDDDDDIIEIPRVERPFNPRPQFPMFRQPPSPHYNIVIRVPREIGDMLFGMVLMTIKTLGNDQGKPFGLP